jgi:parvulin-like peptidyl-prolyl isomerase
MHYPKIVSSVMFAAVAAVSLNATSQPLSGQTPAPGGETVASVVAVVGDSIITNAFLLDAVSRRIAEYRQNKLPFPTENDPAWGKALQDSLLDQHIADLVILQVISRDTTYKVSEEALNSAVETAYNKTQADAGGPVEFAKRLKESGLTAQSYRTMITGQMRTTELYKMFKDRMSQNRSAPKATQKEIESYFPVWQAQRGPRPALVSFQQIVIPVEPSDTALARAKAKADSIYRIVIKDREQFDDLAKRFSDDAGTREKGGEFGWFVQDEVAREFGRAAFSVPVGTITQPVRTQFGYHVIEVERHRGNQVQARHILISASITPDDIARAKAKADSAAAELRAGGDIRDIIKKYGDPEEDMSVSAVDPAPFATVMGIDMTKATKGDIVGPGASQPGPGQKFTIARITDTSPAGSWTLNDPGVRDAIRNWIEQQKLLDEVVQELKRDTYIEIRPH